MAFSDPHLYAGETQAHYNAPFTKMILLSQEGVGGFALGSKNLTT